MYHRLLRLTDRMERSRVFSSVRKGLLMLVPILVTGSVALMLRSLPVPALQEALQQAAGGFFLRLLDLIYDATLGLISIYLLCGVSYAYASALDQTRDDSFRLLAVIASLGCFIAFFGAPAGEFPFSACSATSLFSAMLCAILGVRLFHAFTAYLPHRFRSYAPGADLHFRISVSMIVPLALCITVFALAALVLQLVTGQPDLNTLLATAMARVFEYLPGELGSGVLFVTLLDLLWFCGMHGGNVMEQVAQVYFIPADSAPDLIVGKAFLDNFALMGGCGATLCLLLALLLFSRDKDDRRLAWSAVPFAIFNMNELLVFGLPVILNPVLLLPFLAVPILSLVIAYGATALGFLPIVMHSVTWTTPALFSGYIATGSFRGVIVQLVILIAGVLLYAPFIRLSEHMRKAREDSLLDDFIHTFWDERDTPVAGGYLGRNDRTGVMANQLVSQLRQDVERGEIPVYYQPQVDEHGRIVGAEALLRWQYHGHAVAPPIAVALAQEDGLFDGLTHRILESAAKAAARLRLRLGSTFQLSVNVTAGQIDDPAFIAAVIKLIQQSGLGHCICLEITEEDAVERYDRIAAHLDRLRESGVAAAIDDFSMGHTSLKYLQNNAFRFVKLDGSLVRSLPDSPRSQEIVRSLIDLGRDLGFEVVAEYVENETLHTLLLSLGCRRFQGYLFSPAIPADDLMRL